MESVETDPLSLDNNDTTASSSSVTPTASAVYVTIPQSSANSTSTKGGQTVIQQHPHQSVIQSTALQLSKGNVIIFKQQPNSVIQSPGGTNLHAVQVVDADQDIKESPHKRQILARRPSFRKILNEIGAGEISEKVGVEAGSSDSSQESSTTTTISIGGQQYQAVIPAGSLQLAGPSGEGLQTIAMTNAPSGGAIVHYAQNDGQFIVPVATSDLSGLKIATSASGALTSAGVVLTTTGSPNVHHSSDPMSDEAARKREIRLMKNREAAKECRAKKKEYIKCLENRVAVLENQNKALIEELKTLKSLYCQNS